MSSLKKKGFTLIELLVVIAIIALLLSIIMPSLQLVKRKAGAIVCMGNAKQIALAWYLYQDANGGYLCSSDPGNQDGYGWVKNPISESGSEMSNTAAIEVTDEDEIRGIEEGVMFPYYEMPKLVHCVSDKRVSKCDNSKIYRTYSIPRCLNGGGDSTIEKFNKISLPSSRIAIIEEADYRNFNLGPWEMGHPGLSGVDDYRWWDPLAVNHGDSSVVGFCDGHAEVHKWRCDSTRQRIEEFALNSELYFGLDDSVPEDGTDDVNWVGAGWAYKGKR